MTRVAALKAPFPYFGGKSRAASLVWDRFGTVPRYVEPFAGSLAVLLARPRPFSGREIVNDADGLLVNTWRALQRDPEAVAVHADEPAAEVDLHARHAWLVGHRESITSSLEGDPDWFDARAAGWWLWGIGLWIGSGWCSGAGPWRVEDGQLLHAGNDGRGIHRQLLHASTDGQGIHRKLLHAGNDGRGIHRQLLHAGNDGQGTARIVGWRADRLLAAFTPIAERLRDALIMCGDWSRVVTPAVMFGSGSGRAGGAGACAVFLDPPYPHAEHSGAVYAKDSAADAAYAAREWALANGNDPRLRIALCGYEGQWDMPGWSEVAWSTKGGYGGGRGGQAAANQRRERIWFSPPCHAASLWETA